MQNQKDYLKLLSQLNSTDKTQKKKALKELEFEFTEAENVQDMLSHLHKQLHPNSSEESKLSAIASLWAVLDLVSEPDYINIAVQFFQLIAKQSLQTRDTRLL